MSLSDCEAVEIMSRSGYIRYAFFVRSVLSVFGIAATATIFKIRGNYMCFHPNGRLLLHSYILWNFILSASFLVMNVTDAVRFAEQHSNSCDYMIDIKTGYPIRAFNITAVFGIEITMLSFCIERAVAVFFYTKYEKSTSRKLAYIMIVFQIVGSIWSAVGINIGVTDFDVRTISLQLRTPNNLNYIKLMPLFHCTYGLTSLVVLHGLLIVSNIRLHRWKHRAVNSNTRSLALGEKYQLQENRQSIRSILPVFWATFILCNISAIALFIRNAIWISSNQLASIIFNDFFNNIVIFLPFVVCALMLSRFPKLREKLCFWYIRKKHTSIKHISNNEAKEANEYFDYLKNQWGKASDQERPAPVLTRLGQVTRIVI